MSRLASQFVRAVTNLVLVIFMAASAWPPIVMAVIGLLVSFIAWRRHASYRPESEAQRTNSWTENEKIHEEQAI